MKNEKQGVKRDMRFHYTNGQYWQAILDTGYLKLSTAYIIAGESPGVWFSSNPVYEQSAQGLLPKLKNEQTGEVFDVLITPEEATKHIGVYRIVVEDEIAPVPWAQHKAESGIPPEAAEEMEAKGGNPNEWFASYKPVPVQEWVRVDKLKPGGLTEDNWEAIWVNKKKTQ